ncbi:DUF4835 family protein [Rhodohalobacter barkolensis]|uniref:DUF4835 domain-containing protein n=1 Tax=Rhodohalobacter barkolensis TaxID=2053187 RepID=A0A2N0VFL2_9BACT|nr:DUF4835 family protein [Rhodohalobacter barkolensis]PKD42979.1 DUF4835 domain-containing protein [Rhodohalobacter barkolensis]
MKDKLQIIIIVKLLLLLALTLSSESLNAQELNCTVSINDRQISGSSYDYISELGPALERYLNENRWTDDRYQEHERILCNIQIILTDSDSNSNFTAEAVITASRPIYNSNRQTNLFVISDSNWRFNYTRNKNLIFDDLQFDELTTFIDFYTYILLGYDYDSFSELGGTSFFNNAQEIFEIAQNTGAQGWGRSIGAQRNRFGLINDITNPSYRNLRAAYYRYHRLGLDQFTENPEEARNEIVEALDEIRETKRVTSNNYLFDIFFGTKSVEITAALMDATPSVRTAAYNILSDADPANTSEYRKLME